MMFSHHPLRCHPNARIFYSVCLGLALSWTVPVFHDAVASPAITFTTPAPGYPKAAKASRIEGSGAVRVTYDKLGSPTKVEMVKSTGSLLLDRNTILTVRQQWRSSGGQEITKTVAVEYQLPPEAQGTQSSSQGVRPSGGFFNEPKPPYPAAARHDHGTGDVGLRVTYGADGRPTKVAIIKSSGSAVLDGFTADFARMHWRSYSQATVHDTMISFRLR